MKLYLVRHGEAVTGPIDEERPLSAKGQWQVKCMADFLNCMGVSVQNIYHSGLLRAEQTAQMLAQSVNPEKIISYKKGLLPEDSTQLMASEMSVRFEDCMLVGHLPFMGHLLSELLLESVSHHLVDIQPATIICLQGHMGSWMIAWILNPSLLERIYG